MHPSYSFRFRSSTDTSRRAAEAYEAFKAAADLAFEGADSKEDYLGKAMPQGPEKDTQFQKILSSDKGRRYQYGDADVICTFATQIAVDPDPIEEGFIEWGAANISSRGVAWETLRGSVMPLIEEWGRLGNRWPTSANAIASLVDEAAKHDTREATQELAGLMLDAARRYIAEATYTLDLRSLGRLDLTALLESSPTPETIARVSLANCALSLLPEVLRRFPNLESLLVYSNALEDLPQWVGDFEKLAELNMHDCGVPAKRQEDIRARLPGVRITF